MLLHVSKHFQGFLVNILYVCVCSIAQLCLTLWTPWIVAHQAPLSMGFSTQEYCGVGSHFLFQTIFLTQGSNPRLLHLLPWQADSLSLYHLGNLVHIYVYQSVQLLSCVQLFATHGLQHTRPPCPSPTPRACSNSCPSSWGCQVMPSNHLILCHPLLILPSVFPSLMVWVFFNELVPCIGWPKYWSLSFIISPSNVYMNIHILRIYSKHIYMLSCFSRV